MLSSNDKRCVVADRTSSKMKPANLCTESNVALREPKNRGKDFSAEKTMSDSSPTTKKRKTNFCGATVPDSSHNGGSSRLTSRLGHEETTRKAQSTCGGEKLTQKLDAMMQMMSRMEERCCRLEAECNSLKTMLDIKTQKIENMLEINTNSIKEHVDSKFVKQHEYNSMLLRNHSWKYSAPVYSEEHWIENGYNQDEARYLTPSSECLKDFTEKMRKGEFPSVYNDGRKGIDLNWDEEDPILDPVAMSQMCLYWDEFVEALEKFNPAFGVPGLLKDALMNEPFQTLSFVNKTGVDDDEGMSVDAILDIVESNKHLRDLTIGNNRIQLGHMEKICSAVCRGSIVELGLYNCFENGLGDDMMTYLLTNIGSKLQRLGLESNGITSNGIALLANFLATNPPLKELDLMNNGLSDDCVDLLANALRSNRSLRLLQLSGNTINDDGKEAFRLVLNNDSSLNSIADSNHSCRVDAVFHFDCWNVCKKPESFNRARKIYNLLSKRNKSMSTSNVQHFDGIDVKILPFMLRAVQTYASEEYPYDCERVDYCRVEPLSIVYEVMRKWDKVFPLYTD